MRRNDEGGLEPTDIHPVRSRKGMTASIAVLVLICSLMPAVPVHCACSTSPFTDSPDTRAAPPGYVSMDDLVTMYPSSVSMSGDHYEIVSSIDLPANKPLYIGAGQELLFAPSVHLNLSGPPLISGTDVDMVRMSPLTEGTNWGGINLLEEDPETSPVISNLSLDRATIGIKARGSDPRIVDSIITNCSRSGMELLGPLGGSRTVVVQRTAIINSTYYGVHLQKVEDFQGNDILITASGTGMRLFESSGEVTGLSVLGSTAMGVFGVNSELMASEVEITGSSAGDHSASYQLILVNSSAKLEDGLVGGANVCISSISGSDIALSEIEVGPSFTDGIQTLNSSISMERCVIAASGESGLHLAGSEADLLECVIENNGAGSGGFVFSGIYAKDSIVSMESSQISGSGDGNVHLSSSRMTMGNSTLSSFGNVQAYLESSSTLNLINVPLPEEIEYLDPLSRARSLFSLVVKVEDYSTGSAVDTAQVDVTDREGMWAGSSSTGSDGRTPPTVLLAYTNSSSGTFSYVPMEIIVQAPGYDATSYTMLRPETLVTMELYPPNDPPDITLLFPTNGTSAERSLVIEGRISDDLDIFNLKVRIDGGSYATIPLPSVSDNGYFSISISILNLSSGTHSLWVHAFDGSHSSAPSVRTIVVINTALNDNDGDGLMNRDEDRDQDGTVDEGETDPEDPDSDGDGLLDGIELDATDGNSTDPLDPDSDGDFLLDGIEDMNGNGRVDAKETDPKDQDTDGDTVSDKNDRHPLDPTKADDDDDGDGDKTTVLIFAVVLIVLIGILIFILVNKTMYKGGSRDDEGPRKAERPMGRTDRNEERNRSQGNARRRDDRRPLDRPKGR